MDQGRAPPGLPDRFELLEELGRGGMGVVYRARERASGREVALKVLAGAADADLLLRFQREGQAAAGLRHPGVVAVHAAGSEGGRPWLACELVEGARPLDRAWADLPRAARVGLVRDAARALGHAHARGVVHRDVKADNLLVGRDGRVRVADFGLALVAGADRLTATGAVLGTPHAMAPEQVLGDRDAVGPATDVWALGAVLYEALTGRRPFAGPTFAEVARQVVGAAPAAPRSLDPTIPRPLEAACLRALERDPAARWPDGEALARGLELALRADAPSGAGRAACLLSGLAPLALLLGLVAAVGRDPPPAGGAAAGAAAPAPPATSPPPAAASTPPRPLDAAGALADLDEEPEGAPDMGGLPPPDQAALDAVRAMALAAPDLTFALGYALIEGDGGYRRDVPAGLALVRRAAEATPPQVRACFYLGELHRRGRHVAPDAAAARAWYRRAAEGGDPDGMHALASLLAFHPERPDDPAQGLRWAERAAREARRRRARAHGLVGRLLAAPPPGLEPDPAKAIPWLVVAAVGGHHESKQRLAEALLLAPEPDRFPKAARVWLARAADDEGVSADDAAQLRARAADLPEAGPKEAAKALARPAEVLRDPRRREDPVERATRHAALRELGGLDAALARRECLDASGCASCCAAIGQFLAGSPRRYDRALAVLYLEACRPELPEAGAPYAWHAGDLGLLAPDEARRLLRAAAADARPDDALPVTLLARHLVEVPPAAPEEARRLLEAAPTPGLRARSLLGRYLARGVGGPPDPARAAAVLRACAREGDGAAMEALAELLESGAVAPEAGETAAAWRRRAAGTRD